MKRKGLALKFFLPVTLALAALIGLAIWGVSSYQTTQAEKAFEEHLTSLAAASNSMFHADAEEYCRTRGMTFHRVQEGLFSKDPEAAAFERKGQGQFAANPALQILVSHYTEASRDPRIYALSPGRLKEGVRIALPSPRTLAVKRTPEFAHYTDHIWRAIEQEVRRSIDSELVEAAAQQ